MSVKLYVKWLYCIKGECPEGYCNHCNLESREREYPKDGICYEPWYGKYDAEIDALGAYEKEAV